MPRVCLIIPPSPFLLDQKVFPHLGILKVAAALDAVNISPRLLDLSGYAYPEAVLNDFIRSSDHMDAFGFTASTPQMPAVRQLSQVIRDCDPKSKIILGGAHATMVAAAQGPRAQRLRDQILSLVDVAVEGDGELSILRALAQPTGWVRSHQLNPADLDEYIPAREFLNLSEYKYEIDGANATSLVGQLGCPFKCKFCGGRSSPNYNRIRARSIDSIIAELLTLVDYGYKGMMFFDDELNVGPNFVPLLEAIIGLKLDLKLRGFVKAELFTSTQADLMYKAGFRWILSGFESGSPRMLRNMGKTSTVEDNDECIEIAKAHNLKVKALMSMGHPGENAETIQETKRWMQKVEPDDFDITLITPYPGSKYYDDAQPHSSGMYVYRDPTTQDALYTLDMDFCKQSAHYKGEEDLQSNVWTESLYTHELSSARKTLDRELRGKPCV